MITPSPRNDKGHARRLLVTLVITTAAAAVTAGVVLKKHHPGEAAAAAPVPAGAITAPGAPALSRRVEWRDPWKRPAPLSESASTSINDVPDDGATRSDPSLPSAATALGGASGSSTEPASTF